MKKHPIPIVLALLALIAIGFSYVLLSNNDDTAPPADSATQQATSTPLPTTADTMSAQDAQQKGTYVAYTAESLAAAAGKKLLFFHAPWCSQCRSLDKDIQQGDIPSGVTVFKVDYDTNQSLRQKYGVTLQTTVVSIDEQGNFLEKFVAYDSPTFKAVSDNLLQ